MAEKKRHTDWEAIERDYRAGVKSLRAIAGKNEITEGAIRKRAKAMGWERDLTEQVQKAARAKLVRDEVRASVRSTHPPEVEAEIVDSAADIQVAVIRAHRKCISRGHDLTLRLMSELDATTAHLDALPGLLEAAGEDSAAAAKALTKVTSLSSRIASLFNLSLAAKNWITMERQAFNIEDGGDDDPEDDKTVIVLPSNGRE